VPKKTTSRTLAALAVILLLSSCAMPEKPDGADVPGMTRLGDQMRAQGDDVGAANFYQRALERNPKDTAARKNLAEILEAHGENVNAEVLYAEGLQINPASTDLLRGRGRVLIKLGRYADARDAYEQALQINSDDTKVLNGLGISLDYLNQHEAAQKAYRTALDDEPGNLATLNNLAHSYILSGAYDEAIKLLEPYAQDKNASSALRQNLAEAYGLAGMEADAARMARMDLPPEQVQRNLAYYRAQRVKLSLVPKLYADLGSFATEAMAQAKMNVVQNTFADDVAGLVMTTTPEVKVSGGTPSFVVQVTGFANAAKLHTFCDKLKNSDLSCRPVTG
jgi:Flp pilus assembly protein TadD